MIPAFATHNSLANNFIDQPTQFFLRLATVPTAQRRLAYVTLINSLVSSGVWAQLDALYILAAADAATANVNLKQSAGTLTPVNSPVFTTDRGYQCSGGALSRLSTGINSSTLVGGKMTSSSVSYFYWPLNFSPLKQGTNLGTACSYGIGIDGDSGTNGVAASSNGEGEVFVAQANDGSNFTSPTSPVAAGMYAADRNGTAVGAYYNGLQLGSATHATAVLFNGTTLIGVGKDVTVANNYSPNPIACAGFGGSLGTAGQLALYNAVNTYLLTIGAIATDPYAAFANRLITAPTAGRATLYQNLINGLISDGVWAKLDMLHIYAAADGQTSRTNLVQDRFILQGETNSDPTVSGPTFTADRGWTVATSGLNATLICNLYDPSGCPIAPAFVPVVGGMGVKYLVNDAHTMLFRVTNDFQSDQEEMTFNGNHTSGTLLTCRSTGNQIRGEINTNESIGSGLGTASVSSAIGMTTSSRSVSTSCTTYGNRGAPPSDTQVSGNQNRVSLALAGADGGGKSPWVFGQGTNNGAGTAARYAAASNGGSLTATDITNLYHRLYTYLNAVGAI